MDSQTTVDGLFSQKIEFRVPSYQRAYSWRTNDGGNDQVGQFLRDIKEQPEGQPYFLGHFLFELMEEGTRKYNVVDGQQRLTTIVIFMSCLLAELKRNYVSVKGVNEDFHFSCWIKVSETTEASLRRTRKWLPKKTLHPISAGFSPLNPDLGNGFWTGDQRQPVVWKRARVVNGRE